MLAWKRTRTERFRGWRSAGAVDREFEQEMESHLGLLAEENVRRGMTPEDARRAVRVDPLVALRHE